MRTISHNINIDWSQSIVNAFACANIDSLQMRTFASPLASCPVHPVSVVRRSFQLCSQQMNAFGSRTQKLDRNAHNTRNPARQQQIRQHSTAEHQVQIADIDTVSVSNECECLRACWHFADERIAIAKRTNERTSEHNDTHQAPHRATEYIHSVHSKCRTCCPEGSNVDYT